MNAADHIRLLVAYDGWATERLLAQTEGLFAETAGGVTVATLRQLLERGQLDPDAETVLYNTGDGLKTLDAVAGLVGPSATITPSYSAFEKTGLA